MWPTVPPSWLLPWVIWRLKYAGIAGSPPIPAGTPKTIPPWAWGFLKWVVWCRNGRVPSKRPVSTAKALIPTTIPKWAWSVYKQVLQAVPIEPPPGPWPPAEPTPANSWKLPWPVVYTSWGPRIDWREMHDWEAAIDRFVASGFRTLALQIGMYPAHYPQEVKDRGLKLALWTPMCADSDGDDLANAVADGYILQVEKGDEYDAALRQAERGTGAGLSRSIVCMISAFNTWTTRPDGTEHGRETTVQAEQLIDHGITHAQVECYTGDMHPMDVAGAMWEADHRGFYYANPIVGFSDRAFYLVHYQPDIDRYGRQIGVYLGEPMQARHYEEIRNL